MAYPDTRRKLHQARSTQQSKPRNRFQNTPWHQEHPLRRPRRDSKPPRISRFHPRNPRAPRSPQQRARASLLPQVTACLREGGSLRHHTDRNDPRCLPLVSSLAEKMRSLCDLSRGSQRTGLHRWRSALPQPATPAFSSSFCLKVSKQSTAAFVRAPLAPSASCFLIFLALTFFRVRG